LEEIKLISEVGYSILPTTKFAISPTKFIMFITKTDFAISKTFQEIWESDGTTAGTKKLFQLSTSRPFNNQQEYSLIGNKLYFNGYDDKSGNELYVLDFTCPNSITLSSAIENNASYRASSKIELSSEIKAVSNVSLEANNQIILKPGTNINSSNVFKAEIRNCGN
jgi:hypothetical protein